MAAELEKSIYFVGVNRLQKKSSKFSPEEQDKHVALRNSLNINKYRKTRLSIP